MNPPQSNKQPVETQSSKSSTGKAKQHKMGYRNEEVAGGSRVQVTSKPNGQTRGRRGHLKRMTEIPMDILYEIFSFLGPIDLLHLSWTSTLLRSTIMNDSARFLWTNAFNVLYVASQAPPPCPPDLNLAQYTKLLFVKRCVECNSRNSTHVLWPHRLRVCSSCLEGEKFTALTTLNRYWLGIPVMRIFVHGKQHRYTLTSELNEVRAKMDSIGLFSDKWSEYVEERQAWMSGRRLDEWKFAQWETEERRDKKNDLEEVRVRRRIAIIANLSDLGWKEELDRLTGNQVLALPGMRIAKPLTNEAWEELRPEVIEQLKAIRKSRLEQEGEHRIVQRCRILSKKISGWATKQIQPQDMIPRVLDVALSEPFKSFIFGDTDTEPPFITDKNELAKTMERFTEAWNEERNQFLFSLLPEPYRKPNAKGKGKAIPSALDLATTFFRCSSGQGCPSANGAIPYPGVLTHSCQRSLARKEIRRDTDPDGFWKLSTHFYTRPWLHHCQDLSFDQKASSVAKMVIQECGEHPDEATAEKMDELGLECVRCSKPKRGRRCMMKWDMAIRHELDKHRAECGRPLPKGKEGTEQPLATMWRLVTDPEDLVLINSKGKNGPTGRTVPRMQSMSGSVSENYCI